MAIFSEALEFTTGFDLSGLKAGADKARSILDGLNASAASAFDDANSSLKTFASEIEDTRKRLDGFEKGLQEIGDGFGAVDRLAIGAADVLEVFGFEAEQSVRKVSDLAGGIEGLVLGTKEILPLLGRLGPVIGAVTVAVGAGVTAWTIYKNAVGDAEQELETLRGTSERLKGQLSGLSDEGIKAGAASWSALGEALETAREDLAVTRGELSETDVAIRRETEAIEEQARAALVSYGQQEAAIKARINADQQLIAIAREKGKEDVEANKRLVEGWQELRRVESAQNDLKTAIAGTIGATRQNLLLTERQAEEEKAAAEAKRKQAEAEREYEKSQRERAQATEQLVGIEQQARLATLEGEDAILYARDLQLAQIGMLEESSLNFAQAEAARAAVRAQTEMELTSLKEQEAARQAQIAEDLSAREASALRERESTIATHQSLVLGAFEQFARERIEGEKTLGESVKALFLGFLADELRLLATQLGTKAAAFYVSGQIGKGLLYTAGAAVALAGAAGLDSAASSGVSSSGSTPSTSSSTQALTPTQAADQRSSGDPSAITTGETSSARTSSSGSSGRTNLWIGHRAFEAQIQESASGGALRDELDSANPNPSQRVRI
jgi:hypothetical protein